MGIEGCTLRRSRGALLVTDCKGLPDSLQQPTASRTGSRAALARIWNDIHRVLDQDVEALIRRLRWMPAHLTQRRVADEPPLDSQGSPVTWLMWRANRVADHLVRRAALATALPAHLIGQIKCFKQLQMHQATRLGQVTYAANHYSPGPGQPARRDSEGARPLRNRGPPTQQRPAAASSGSQPAEVQQQQQPARESRKAKRRRRTLEAAGREAVREAACLADRLAATAAVSQPASQPTAAERLAALAERVRAKVSA